MRQIVVVVLLSVFSCASARPAHAIAQFQKEWLAFYAKDHKDKEFAEYVTKKVKCYICHQGKKRKNHNPYGQHLVELLDKKKDRKDKKKMDEAFEKVGKMHSDPKDKKSPTYAELIAESKLPGGKLEDVKKEPKEEDAKEEESAAAEAADAAAEE